MSILVNPYIGPFGAAYGAEATALFGRMAVQPDATRKGLVDDLIASLLAGAVSGTNVWAMLDGFYMMAAHTDQAGLLNWKQPLYNLTAVNAPNFIADQGYNGDGATSYLDPSLSTFQENPGIGAPIGLGSGALPADFHMAVWSRTVDQVGDDFIDFGACPASANTAFALAIRRVTTSNTGKGTAFRPGAANAGSVTDGTELFLLQRSGSTTRIYRNAAQIANALGVATLADFNGPVHIGHVTDLATDRYSTRQFAFASFGRVLSINQQTDLYNAVHTYLAAIGAA